MKTYESTAGEEITEAANAMMKLADETGEAVESEFNGIKLITTPGTIPAVIIEDYYAQCYAREQRDWGMCQRCGKSFEFPDEGEQLTHFCFECASVISAAAKDFVEALQHNTPDAEAFPLYLKLRIAVATNSKDAKP